MQRYFIAEENWMDDKVIITGDDAKHIGLVMRMQIDDHIICVHPNVQAASCRIIHIEKNRIEAIVEESIQTNSELPIKVTIVHGLPKGQKAELVLQKGTELGASGFQFFTADRSIVKWDNKKAKQKLTRFEKIVKEAAEQSHRSYVPDVFAVQDLQTIVKQTDESALILFADEELAKKSQFPSLASIFQEIRGYEHIYVVIGPEGGLSDDERTMLIAHKALPIRLGPRILRTETAPLYFLSAISYFLEEK